MRRKAFLIAIAAVATPAIGQTTRPTPRDPRIDRLVAQLGAADFREREAAARKLEEMGPVALDALREAMGKGNPEVATRAEALVRQWESPPLPSGPLAMAGRRFGVNVRVGGAMKMIETVDAGRRVAIRESPEGVAVTVTGTENGKEVSRTISAANPAELRQKNPEAFALYKRWSPIGGAGEFGLLGDGAVDPRERFAARMIEANLGLGGGGLLPLPIDPLVGLPPFGGDNLLDFSKRLDRQMQDANLTLEQRKQVVDQMQKLQQVQAVPGADLEGRMALYNRLSDELRDKLKALKLPDPGEALPPPARSRLGVSMEERPNGLAVRQVLPGSRAEKLGLKPGDVIQNLNGEKLAGVQDLRRRLLLENKTLAVDVLRDGEAMKLQEPPPATQPTAK